MKPTIIIACESNAMNRKIYDLLRQTKRYKIIEVCSDKCDAESNLLRYKPHLAILSANYCNGSGVSVSRKLKMKGIKTKIALLSDNEDVTMMRLALEFGVRAYFRYIHDGQIFECLNALNKNEFYVDTKLYHSHYFARRG